MYKTRVYRLVNLTAALHIKNIEIFIDGIINLFLILAVKCFKIGQYLMKLRRIQKICKILCHSDNVNMHL